MMAEYLASAAYSPVGSIRAAQTTAAGVPGAGAEAEAEAEGEGVPVAVGVGDELLLLQRGHLPGRLPEPYCRAACA